jgi:glycosyltransferase involved in cell wall biosynthesis
LKILWLTEHYYPGRGGMAVACDRIVHGLRRRGAWIDVVHFRRTDLPQEVLKRENGSDRTVPVAPDAPHALAALWARLERENAGWTHVVAFGGALPLAAAPAYAAWLGAPLVVLLRGNDFDTGLYAPERRRALDDAIRRAARVGCVTEDQRRRVQRLFPSASALWTPNGIESEEWRALPSDLRRAEAIRAEHARPGRKLLGLFGDLKPKKGIELLLEALGSSDIRLLAVGEADEALLARFRERGDVVLPPRARTELIPLYLACDAVALPSLYKGFPNVLLEAAALGVPLVASDAGGAGVLRDGVHGAVFAAGDVEDCARALQRFNSFERKSLAAACLELAAEFSAAREAERFLELFGAKSAAYLESAA